MNRSELANAIRQERHVSVTVSAGPGVIRGINKSIGGTLNDSGAVAVWLFDGRRVRVPIAEVSRSVRPRPEPAPGARPEPAPLPFEPAPRKPTVDRPTVEDGAPLARMRQDGRTRASAAPGTRPRPETALRPVLGRLRRRRRGCRSETEHGEDARSAGRGAAD